MKAGALLTILMLVMLAEDHVNGGPIRISFLDNEAALKQTIGFLSTNGCNPSALKIFEKAVRWNNESPLGFDTSKFPPAENGFYSFPSVSNLLQALPQPILNAVHPYQLNCYDAAILLAGNSLKTDLQPDSSSGPFLTPSIYFTNISSMAIEETPRDAFNCYPGWYIEGSKAVFNETMQSRRICLTAVLNSYCVLPHSTTPTNAEYNLLQTLRSNWKHCEVTFPANPEVVLCHSAVLSPEAPDSAAPFASTTHVGLLFKNHDQFVYLEKAGIRGPYIRMDFTDRRDLLPWIAALVAPTVSPQNRLFVTFNDSEIQPLSLPKN